MRVVERFEDGALLGLKQVLVQRAALLEQIPDGVSHICVVSLDLQPEELTQAEHESAYNRQILLHKF